MRDVNWQYVENKEDPSWLESHCEVMSKRYGRCMLKVWHSSSGEYRLSIIDPSSCRRSYTLLSENMNDAQQEALKTAYAN